MSGFILQPPSFYWMCAALVFMAITTALTKHVESFAVEKWIFWLVSCLLFVFQFPTTIIVYYAGKYPFFHRAWGKFVQSFVFLATLFLSGVPNFIREIESVWQVLPLFSLFMWGLGLEMGFQRKMAGNVFSLCLSVSYSVGILMMRKPGNPLINWVGAAVGFGIPVFGTILYQKIIPDNYNSARLRLLVHHGHIHPMENIDYTLQQIENDQAWVDGDFLVELSSGARLRYRWTPSVAGNQVYRMYEVSDQANASIGEVFGRIWDPEGRRSKLGLAFIASVGILFYIVMVVFILTHPWK